MTRFGDAPDTLDPQAVEAMRQRIATMEFRALTGELEAIAAGQITLPQSPVSIGTVPFRAEAETLAAAGLPQLPLRLGSIAVDDGAEALPKLAIAVPAGQVETSALAFIHLFSQQNLAPVGRLLFLCESPEFLPLLRRFQFSVHLTRSWPEDLEWLVARFGLDEVRNLSDGAVLWPGKVAEDEPSL